MPVLTHIDVTGIQAFVFLSNRLRDAVAGSVLVEKATDTGVDGILNTIANRFGGNVIMAAGGNALTRFDDMSSARSFTAAYSRTILECAPGLEVAICHHEYLRGELAKAIRVIRRDMVEAKFNRESSTPVIGLSVVAQCAETRLPAADVLQGPGGEPPVPVSAAIAARRRQAPQPAAAICAFREGKGPTVDLCYPMDIDNLGRTRADTSLLGVVHIDGNKMGSRMAEWTEKQIEAGASDEEVQLRYGEISRAIDDLAKQTLQSICEHILTAIRWQSASSQEPDSGSSQVAGNGSYVLYSETLGKGFPLRQANGRATNAVYLPIRPIIVGGDDITFVCDGRIALDLAEVALRHFMRTAIHGIGRVTASAGIAMGKSHTPFARLYEVSEALCQSAKQHLHKNHLDDSCMDWHIGLSGITDAEALRKRTYTSPDGKYRLTCRPYPLGDGPDAPETWTWLNRTILGSRNAGGLFGSVWQRHRNKISSLRDALVNGPASVERTVESWNILSDTLSLPGGPALSRRGYVEDRTPFLDAIELLDIHYPLGKE
ncbi:MAG: hypothetical protein AB1700_05360 [Bacillota bacterium]